MKVIMSGAAFITQDRLLGYALDVDKANQLAAQQFGLQRIEIELARAKMAADILEHIAIGELCKLDRATVERVTRVIIQRHAQFERSNHRTRV